jgi:hypothetical protein
VSLHIQKALSIVIVLRLVSKARGLNLMHRRTIDKKCARKWRTSRPTARHGPSKWLKLGGLRIVPFWLKNGISIYRLIEGFAIVAFEMGLSSTGGQ